MLGLQLCCHPAQILISPVAPTLEGRHAWGPVPPKLPCQSLQLSELVWAVAVQTMKAWLGSCPCFPRASDRLASELPKVSFLPWTGSAQRVTQTNAAMYRFRGSHEVRVGGSLRELETSLCSADKAGRCRRKCVCVNSGFWKIQPPPTM